MQINVHSDWRVWLGAVVSIAFIFNGIFHWVDAGVATQILAAAAALGAVVLTPPVKKADDDGDSSQSGPPSMLPALLATAFCFLPSACQAQQPTVTVYTAYKHAWRPDLSHTWTVWHGPQGECCLSWLPASGTVRPLALTPEPGVLLSHAATVRWAARHGCTVRQSPIREVSVSDYAAARERAQTLASGARDYRALDVLPSSTRSNCVHAAGGFAAGPAYGRAAALVLALHFSHPGGSR